MKPNQISSILDLALSARRHNEIFNPLFVSPPGLGKTEIVAAFARARGLEAVTLSMATMDPPDFKGFPMIRDDEHTKTKRLSFALPDAWPTDPTSKGVIILEELNRSPSSVMQCVLSLTDARRGFDGYKLPDGWVVVACINPDTEHYDTSMMDPALQDRFETFHVEYDKKSFLDYIQGAEWDASIVNFIKSDLWSYKAPEDIKEGVGSKYVAPRTFSRVNSALKAGMTDTDTERLVFLSILGTTTGRMFYSFRHDETPVLFEDVMTDTRRSLKKLEKWADPKNYKNGMISILVDDLISNAKLLGTHKNGIGTVAKICHIVGPEHTIGMLHGMERTSGDKTLLKRVFEEDPSLKVVFKNVIGKVNT